MPNQAISEPSEFAKRVHQEYTQKNAASVFSTKCDEDLLDQTKNDQTHYSHFKPHIFLIEDIAETILEDGYSIYNKQKEFTKPQQIIANYSKTELWAPDASQIILTNGEDSGLLKLLEIMCEEGDNVVMCSPGCLQFEALCKAYKVEVRKFKIEFKGFAAGKDNWQYDQAGLCEQIDGKTRFLYIQNPNWAIGQILEENVIKNQIQTAESKELPILVDETFQEYPIPTKKVYKFGNYNHNVPVISINGGSRLFGLSGMRLGWMVLYGEKSSFQDLLDGLKANGENSKMLDNFIRNSIGLCYDTIEKVGYQLERMKIIEIRNKHFHKIFNGIMGMRLGNATAGYNNQIYVDMNVFKKYKNVTEVAKELAEKHNLHLLPGDAFGAGDVLRYDNCLSINLFKELIDRLKDFCELNLK